MKSLVFTMHLAAVLTFMLTAAGAARADSPAVRAIDVRRSSAQFSVSHIWVGHVTGTVPISGGSVTLGAGSVVPIQMSAVLDASGISTGDPDRDRALKSSDFFDVKRFPAWTFVSTRIVPENLHAFGMDGNLTIHGVTQPEHLEVTVSQGPGGPVYRASAQIDRHAFGMPITRLDPVIGPSVDVTLLVMLDQRSVASKY